MNNMKIYIAVAFSIFFIKVSGQSILQDYFKGNKDSMVTAATNLINIPEPTFKHYLSIKGDTIKSRGKKEMYKTKNKYFITRDNQRIFAYQFPKNSRNTIIFIHGVKSDASDYLNTAQMLQKVTKAEIYAVDLRGHGKSDGKLGDVDYINQYADDIADIVKTVRNTKPNGKIIIAAHSMGGGVALRYSMLKNKTKVDGYLLFAPLIGNNSPAIPKSAPVENDSIEPLMKIHFARIIGLKMFNELNRHEFDSLPVLFFNLPESTPLREYTYRADISFAPDDYKEGLKSVKEPMLVLIGKNDEAFVAAVEKEAVVENSKGEVYILDGATHESIRQIPQSYVIIKKWFSSL
jgi:alpha-beta hydrolase superfamily lysophospholipase